MRRRYANHEEGVGSVYDKSRNDNPGLITQLSSRLLFFLAFCDAPLDAFHVKEEQSARDKAADRSTSSMFHCQ